LTDLHGTLSPFGHGQSFRRGDAPGGRGPA
jgi:hypothetical protein